MEGQDRRFSSIGCGADPPTTRWRSRVPARRPIRVVRRRSRLCSSVARMPEEARASADADRKRSARRRPRQVRRTVMTEELFRQAERYAPASPPAASRNGEVWRSRPSLRHRVVKSSRPPRTSAASRAGAHQQKRDLTSNVRDGGRALHSWRSPVSLLPQVYSGGRGGMLFGLCGGPGAHVAWSHRAT